jgi:hypothetical protein
MYVKVPSILFFQEENKINIQRIIISSNRSNYFRNKIKAVDEALSFILPTYVYQKMKSAIFWDVKHIAVDYFRIPFLERRRKTEKNATMISRFSGRYLRLAIAEYEVEGG